MCVLLIATATAMEKETVRPRSCTPAGGPYGGSVSQSRSCQERNPSDSCSCPAGSRAEGGATLSAGQPRGPRTLTYECRARDADTGAGRAGGATDGPAQCSTFATVAIAGWADCNQWTEEAFVGRRLLDECRARDADTGAGRAGVPPMVPPGAVRSSYCVVERQR